MPVSSHHVALASVLYWMIWHPASAGSRSKTTTGAESPSVDQWNTCVSVTSATVLVLIQVQNTTSTGMSCAFIFDFISRLKIWSVLPAGDRRGGRVGVGGEPRYLVATGLAEGMRWDGMRGGHDAPLSAMTLATGFMIALSALMVRRSGAFGLAMSITTSSFLSPLISRTQMNFSDSIVTVLNPMPAVLMPVLASCTEKGGGCMRWHG